MRFSFWTGNGQTWEDTLDGCQHAAATGWDGIWYADHFMPNEDNVDQPIHEAWSILAAIAATVPDVRIGPLVAGNTYRNPALTAKIASTIDHISGGRVILGLGAGWQENEHEKYDFDFSTVGGRLNKLEEACEIVTSLLRNERTNFSGEHYNFTDAPLDPKPVQERLPLLLGGGGEKRTLKITAKYADEWNYWVEPDLLVHKNAVLDGHCNDIGRDPAEIKRTAVALMFIAEDEAGIAKMRGRDFGRATILGTAEEVIDTVGRYIEAGCDELIVPDFTFGDLERKKATMDLFIERVAPNFR
ncbi:MAG: F420-dependent oxidoreductase-like protein [Candidatus Poriferisodalaceae bacterium]|jgi:F420-dependent oxidoreductase-like protein